MPYSSFLSPVIDYLLPQRSSVDLIAALRRDYPQLAILLVTGTTASDEELLRLAPSAWLRKPFSMDELLHALDRVIAADPGVDKRPSASRCLSE